VARYGHQPLSELKRLHMDELDELVEALSAIVRTENGNSGDPET
jgi:hypothetical protein